MSKISIIGISIPVATIVLFVSATIQVQAGINIVPINAVLSIAACVITYNSLVKKYGKIRNGESNNESEAKAKSISKVQKKNDDSNFGSKFGAVTLYGLVIIVLIFTVIGLFEIIGWI